jgi:hypothetical protein
VAHTHTTHARGGKAPGWGKAVKIRVRRGRGPWGRGLDIGARIRYSVYSSVRKVVSTCEHVNMSPRATRGASQRSWVVVWYIQVPHTATVTSFLGSWIFHKRYTKVFTRTKGWS